MLKEVVVMAYTVRQIGNVALMDLPKTSFLSSRKISPEAVLRCYDWAIRMRDEGRCVIGGFQSALEKDVLRFLLKGTQPIVLVLARRMLKIIPEDLRHPVASGRLLIVSPFSDRIKRSDSSTAETRNRFILEHSTHHVFGSVDPNGHLAQLIPALSIDSVERL